MSKKEVQVEHTKDNDLISINQGISFEYIDDLAFIFNTNDGEFYECNESSTEIWKIITENKEISIGNLFNKITNIYSINKNIISDDIINLLSELEFKKLISVKRI